MGCYRHVDLVGRRNGLDWNGCYGKGMGWIVVCADSALHLHCYSAKQRRRTLDDSINCICRRMGSS